MKKEISPYETLAALLVLSIILYLFMKAEWLLVVGLILGLGALLIRPLAIGIHLVWQRFAKALNFIMTHIILTTVFFVFLTPIAFLYRIFNRKKLMTRKNEGSHFITRNHTYTGDDLKRMW